MSTNSGRRKSAQTKVEPAAAAPTETPAVTTPTVVEDDLTTKPQHETPAPVETPEEQPAAQSEAPAEEPVVETVAVAAEVAPVAEQPPVVAGLTTLLATYKEQLSSYGKNPGDFKEPAKTLARVAKYVIDNPQRPVLDALLAFFVENKDGVAAIENIMRGSTTLPGEDERRVGLLVNLFAGLATKRIIPVQQTTVINALKRNEIFDYYNRKANGIKAHR